MFGTLNFLFFYNYCDSFIINYLFLHLDVKLSLHGQRTEKSKTWDLETQFKTSNFAHQLQSL
jgi:hypothetical protein